MFKILLIEDTKECQDLVVHALGDFCDIMIVSDLKSARSQIETRSFDMLIFDLNLPDGDGVSLLSLVETDVRYKYCFKLILSTRQSIEDKLVGFQVGADEYMTKPFDWRELRARVEAKIKRQYKNYGAPIVFGSLVIDVASHKVILNVKNGSESLNLTPTEYRILIGFVKRQGTILSRDELIDIAWGDSVHVTDRSVDLHVSSLRRKLSSMGKQIRTVYGVGYILDSATAARKVD